MKTAHLYVRVSTDEQADKGFSQRDQNERLQIYCQRNNIQVGKIIFEDYSAKTFNRPEWKCLLNDLKKTKGRSTDYIIFTKWDRFSRNTADAYAMIKTLKGLEVEPVAIDQPLDTSVPESKVMLAVYLAMPEVDNDRRALNVFYGMRRGRKEGRWMGRALPGYINRTREDGSKYIALNEPEASHLKWAFHQIAEGKYATEQIWEMARQRGLKCAKNSFWDAVRNPCYCGKIIIPKFKDEEMHLVQGMHEPLISEKTYFKIIDVLNGRRRDVGAKVVCPDNLPLRGFILCPKCSRTLTGSASKGRNGYHYYYHCKSFCGVRYNAVDLNNAFEALLQELVPKAGMAELYKEVVLDSYQNGTEIYREERKRIISQITDQNNRITKSRELLLTEAIEPIDFKEMKKLCEERIIRLEAELKDISEKLPSEVNIAELTHKAVSNLKNIVYLYREADIEGKRNIIGSTFSKKWVFSDVEGRTACFNKSIELIYLINKTLAHKKAGVKRSRSLHSGTVPRAGVEPARPCDHRCLRPARLPIPPSGQVLYERRINSLKTGLQMYLNSL
jgi:site-specific DNA recombinase